MVGGNHPLHFKPAPENLVSKVVSEPEGSGEEGGSGGEGAVGTYVPPRVVAMPYKEEVSRCTSMPKSQLRKSRLIRELRDQVTDFPTEIEVSPLRHKTKWLNNGLNESFMLAKPSSCVGTY